MQLRVPGAGMVLNPDEGSGEGEGEGKGKGEGGNAEHLRCGIMTGELLQWKSGGTSTYLSLSHPIDITSTLSRRLDLPYYMYLYNQDKISTQD